MNKVSTIDPSFAREIASERIKTWICGKALEAVRAQAAGMFNRLKPADAKALADEIYFRANPMGSPLTGEALKGAATAAICGRVEAAMQQAIDSALLAMGDSALAPLVNAFFDGDAERGLASKSA